jgi:hypothetical protein
MNVTSLFLQLLTGGGATYDGPAVYAKRRIKDVYIGIGI